MAKKQDHQNKAHVTCMIWLHSKKSFTFLRCLTRLWLSPLTAKLVKPMREPLPIIVCDNVTMEIMDGEFGRSLTGNGNANGVCNSDIS